MHISLPSTLLALLATTAFALTTTSSKKPTTSPPFTLSSTLVSPTTGNPSFANLNLTSYHTGAGLSWAVLQNGLARPAYLNGTAADFKNENTELLFSGDNFPFGFVIDRVNSTYDPVEINAGTGTKGIFIDQGVVKVHDPLSGGFYACNNTLLYGPAVQVFYKIKYETTPAACSDVFLNVNYS
ncbi:hypothetical protein MMC14_002796 [Varicellaria rhodocarpa]|nr:hypothetical protein [Varicellaria rhodocarpa]